MEKQTLLELNFNIWLLIADLHHKILLVRQKELSHYRISTRQLHILRLIEALGAEAKLSEIAKKADRKHDVISRQAIILERDGLIKRLKETPKSRLLRLELTDEGKKMMKISRYSQGMNQALSVLNKDELLQMRSALNRVLIKLNQYSIEN
jgi:DNA-binding MarR family transcriptional regulator